MMNQGRMELDRILGGRYNYSLSSFNSIAETMGKFACGSIAEKEYWCCRTLFQDLVCFFL